MPLFSSNYPVRIVRDAGTTTEHSWNARMGGDPARSVLFYAMDKVKSGDEIHWDGFDEPRVITRVDAVMASGEVAHWKASIAPRPRRKPSEVSEHPMLAPHPDDPVGENPFPKDHPAHGIWEAATQDALEELFSYKQTMLGRAPKDPTKLIDWSIEYAFRVYQIWAKRNLSIVRNQPGLRGYEQWLDNFLESRLLQSGSKGVQI